MSVFLQLLLNGLSAGAVYALLALGVTLVYGLTGIVNFAHGELLTVGGYLTWIAYSGGLPFYASLAVAVVGVGLLGLLLERGVFRWTLRRPITGFIVSLGLIPVFSAAVISVWGGGARTVFPPIRDAVEVAGARLAGQKILISAIAAALVLVIYLFLTRTQTGRAIRAASEDREITLVLGHNVSRLITLMFVAGCAVAGLGGGLFVSLFPLTPDTGSSFIFKAFAITLIGGLGNVVGTVCAAAGLAVVEALVAGYASSDWSDVIVLIAMMAILLVRPAGLFRGTAGASLA